MNKAITDGVVFMPPPFEASQTFSFQVLTMPSRLSDTLLR